jgi:hypothetical protein
MFVDGGTDYNGPARIVPSIAITKVKRTEKAPSSSHQERRVDEPLLPKPVPPPSRPFIVVQRPVAREVIELPSSEDQAEYEVITRGSKRKLKSSGTTRASKKRAPSDMEQDAKAGKKGVKLKAKGKDTVPSQVPLDSPEAALVKGGPLSPLSLSSSTDDSHEKTKPTGSECYETTCSHLSDRRTLAATATVPLRLQSDGPGKHGERQHTKGMPQLTALGRSQLTYSTGPVKPRPIGKGSHQRGIASTKALRMMYDDKSGSEEGGNESGSEVVLANRTDGQATSKVAGSAPTGPAKSLAHKETANANARTSSLPKQEAAKHIQRTPDAPLQSLHEPQLASHVSPTTNVPLDVQEPQAPPPPDDPCEADHSNAPSRDAAPSEPPSHSEAPSHEAPSRSEAPSHEAPSRSEALSHEAPSRSEAPSHSASSHEAPSRYEAPSRSEAPSRYKAPSRYEAPSRYASRSEAPSREILSREARGGHEVRTEPHRLISPYHNSRMHNEHFDRDPQACEAASHDSHDGTRRQPAGRVYDTREPHRNLHPRDHQIHQQYPHDPIHRREASYDLDRDTLRLRDTAYTRSGNPRDNPGMDNDQHFNMERERSYPDRYSPIPDPVYAHERGPVYSNRHDVEERQHIPPYNDHPAATRGYHDRYYQGRRHQESRWIDHDEIFPEHSREAPPPRRYVRDDRSRNAPDNYDRVPHMGSLSPNIPPAAPPSS